MPGCYQRPSPRGKVPLFYQSAPVGHKTAPAASLPYRSPLAPSNGCKAVTAPVTPQESPAHYARHGHNYTKREKGYLT